MDLERKLCELLHELTLKREECEEVRGQLGAEKERAGAAAAEAGGLRAEAEAGAARLAWAERALRRCEAALADAREAAVTHRLARLASDRLVDSARQQAHRLQLENSKLKKQMEEMHKDIKSEAFFRESCIAKQAKIESAIETLCLHRQKLEKDYKEMDRHSSEAILVGKRMNLLLNHKHETIKELKAKYEQLSATTISEKKSLEDGIKEVNVVEREEYDKDVIKEWETSINEMKARTESHENEMDTLQKSLENAVAAQLMFQKLESAANDKMKDYETKLEEAKQKNGVKNGTDKSVETDTTITFDVACETLGRASCADAAAQTDSPVTSGSLAMLMSRLNREREQDSTHEPSEMATTDNAAQLNI